MKWLIAVGVIVGLLYLGGDRVKEWVGAGRQQASGLTDPIYGLAKTIDQTQARVDETNRKIGALSDQAAGIPAVNNSAAAYGAQARKDLQALGR